MKISTLKRKWRKKQREYELETRRENAALKTGGGDRYAANRYEGIATCYRWCLEDLKALDGSSRNLH